MTTTLTGRQVRERIDQCLVDDSQRMKSNHDPAVRTTIMMREALIAISWIVGVILITGGQKP